jgi:hypothetical protein
MTFRKKFSNGIITTQDRVKKTRLYLMETGAAGNASALIELLSTGVRTAAGSISARNAAVNITYAVEDYACSDYKCLILDTVPTACDITGAVAAFIPGNMTKKVFGVTTTGSCFCRTLRDECKKTNALGCIKPL